MALKPLGLKDRFGLFYDRVKAAAKVAYLWLRKGLAFSMMVILWPFIYGLIVGGAMGDAWYAFRETFLDYHREYLRLWRGIKAAKDGPAAVVEDLEKNL